MSPTFRHPHLLYPHCTLTQTHKAIVHTFLPFNG